MPLFPSRALPLALGVVLLSSSLAVVASSAGAADPQVVSGPDWTVTKVAGGYEVVVDLARPLPVRSDAPTVVVDGAPVGIATEAPDGLSLSVFTTDPSVLSADQVDPGWASRSTTSGAAPSVAVGALTRTRGAADTIDVDPSAPGDYDWTESIYDFGDLSVPLAAIGGVRGEMEGKVYLPTTGGARPVVVLLHGRHTSCYGTGLANPSRWPCATGPDNDLRKPIPSFVGYDGVGRALASHGYAVVSISANAISANDNALAADQGAQARGQLVLDTLSMLQHATDGEPVSYFDSWTNRSRTLDQAFVDGAASYAAQSDGFVGGAPPLDTVTAADLVGRFDLHTIGLMGHSRGGEGVATAVTLNAALEHPWAIKSILPLAPVDFGRETVPDVPMDVMLPYCDGDVSDQQGQHLVDDSRYAFGDDVLRTSTWVMGANHNFFNSVWTPSRYRFGTSDDWSWWPDSPTDVEPTCGTALTTALTSIRMTAAQQYAQGTAYMTAWFRLTLGGEDAFLPMFDGTGAVPAALHGADIRTQATAPSSARSTVTTFEHTSSLVRASGGATAAPCASTSGLDLAQVMAPCTTTMTWAQVPHWTPAANGSNVPSAPMTRMTWTSGSGTLRVAVPPAKRDASGFDRLSVKVAAGETVATGTDLTLRVVDGVGRTWSSPVSALNPAALRRLPTSSSWAATYTLGKIVLQQVNVPIATLAAAGLATSDLREVSFTGATGADLTPWGAAYLSDLAFETSAVGTPRSTTRPTVNVFAPAVDEGDAPSTYDLAVYLDRPATEPVTGYVSLLGYEFDRAGSTMEQVTFDPGETCHVLTAVLQGDTSAGWTNSSKLTASVVNTSGAVVGPRSIVTSTVREDDGTTAPGGLLPPVGTPGPVCDELAGVLAGGVLVTEATAAPGSTTPVHANGFRAGEAVTFVADGTAPVTVLADGVGTATAVLVLPADLATGPHAVTATSFATGRVATGTLPVQDVSTTTLTMTPEVPTLRQPVTLTATVAAADPRGTVEFLDGATSLGTVETVDGVATLELPGFGAGAHSVSAVVGATEATTSSTSVPLAFALDPRATTAVLAVAPAATVFGRPATVDVAVGPEVRSEGQVAVLVGSSVVRVPVDESGHARVTLPRTLPVGSHPVKAVYLGSQDATPSAVVTGQVVVARRPTTTAIRTPRDVRPGRRFRVTVIVGNQVRGVAARGRVRLTVAGAATLTRVKPLPQSRRVTFDVRAPRTGRQQWVRAAFVAKGGYGASTSSVKPVRIVR